MLDLKNRKYKILLHIVIIISFMILLLSIAKTDNYKGKFTFNNISSEKKVLSSVGDTLFASSKGYDEVEYKVNYTLDQIEGVTKRDVIIRGKIDDLDSKYAYFKEIHKNNVTSTLSNNGREIEVRIKNVTLGEEHSINLKIVIEGAPNGKRITPEIYIKESSGEETKISAESILVETRSVEGIVIDEDNLELSTIELSLYKNDEEIRRTFTDERGRFIFTDLEDGEYSIHLEEDNYELINDIVINDETSIEIKLRKVDKYNVEINKYIDKVKLVIDGKEYNYSYNDSKKIVQNIDKAKTISGEIEYKIVVENNSDKLSEVTKVIDERGEGLLFNKEKNPGWEEINDVLVYRPISSETLNPNEKREIKLVLDIENTKESKNYFNEAISKGEIKEKVTYLLNNEVIKEETVYEGDTIKEPLLNIDNFDGWYTDKNYTNKYDFKNEVNKDLILYGRTRIILANHIVTFMSDEDIFYKDIEVLDMTSIEKPLENPVKEHYVFEKWVTENNEEFNFDTLITEDITLYAVFEKVEEPTITISPSTWTKDDVTVSLTNSNSDYQFEYKIDNGNYALYTGEFTVNKNSTIYAYSVYKEVSSEETSLDITNIDKINPIINNLNLSTLTPVQAEISFNLKDNESGIKKYNVYLNNELVYESDEYINLVNEEKNENYIVSGLEELSTYTIKVEAVDKTGNTSYDEISISTPAKVYVCQIESVNGTSLNEPIKLESLTEAIEYNNSGINCLTNTCEIKMLLDIEESSTILNGQDIILNLNGKYISGISDNTIINNGNLQIINNNEETIGHIFNTNGVGIKNNGVLTIGVDEETPVVSKVDPVIEGTIYGIENNNKLNFYDGKIVGNVSTKGEITKTPYLYNASVSEENNKQVIKLQVIQDAEARRNSVYYTSIQTGIDESKTGSIEEANYTRPLIEQTKHDSDYYFVYDSINKRLINNNKEANSTIAHSYLKLDLTNYDTDQILTVNLETIDTIAYIYITDSETMPDINNSTGKVLNLTANIPKTNYNYELEAGKVYYIHFLCRNGSSSSYFIINSINLGDEITSSLSDLSNITMFSPSTYSFVKQEDGTYINNNIYENSTYSSTAYSYFVVDLTNVSTQKYIFVDMEVFNARAKIYVNNSKSSTDGLQVDVSGDTPRTKYPIRLEPNQVNYIHFETYCRFSMPNYKTIIYEIINTEETDIKNITDGVMHNNGDYYFEEYDYNPFIWKDISNNGGDGTIFYAHLNEEETGFKFNEYSSVTSKEYNLDRFTWQVKFNTSIYGPGEIISNYNNNGGLSLSGNSGMIRVGFFDSDNKESYFYSNAKITYGQDMLVTLTYDGTIFKLYVNGVLDKTYESTFKSQTSNKKLVIGSRFKGTIYNVKVFDKALEENELDSQNNIVLNLDGSNFKNSEHSYINTNNNINIPGGANLNTTADSYMTFDLSDAVEDTFIIANIETSTYYYNYPLIVVTDSPDTPSIYDSNKQTLSYNSKGNYKIRLKKGRINYVHFLYNLSTSTNMYDYYNSYKINSIKYYINSDTGTIPVYVFGDSHNSSTDTFKSVTLNQEEDTVQLIKNITLSKPLEIDEKRAVKLDLNGYTLTTSGTDYVIRNKGNLTIEKLDNSSFDNVQDEIGTITSTTGSIILNEGYLNVKDANIVLNKSGSHNSIINNGSLSIGTNGLVKTMQSDNRGIVNNPSGIILEGSGKIETTSSGSIGLLNYSLLEVPIKGYTITNNNKNSYNFYNNSIGNVTVDGITSNGPGTDIYQGTNGNLTIKNSSLNSSNSDKYSYTSNSSSNDSIVTFDNCTIKNIIYSPDYSYRKIVINNSTLESSKENITNKMGEVSILNSTLNEISYYTNINNHGKLIMKNSTINSASRASYGIISNYENSNTSLENVTFNFNSNNDRYVIENKGNLEIIGGTVNRTYDLNNATFITNTNTSSSTAKVTVKGNINMNPYFNTFISNQNGEVVIGEDDGTVNAYPNIKVKSKVVNNSGGTFKFYDGKLEGAIDSTIYGVINEIPNDYDTNVTTDNDTEIITLEKEKTNPIESDYVASIGNKKYTLLATAFEDVSTNNTETEIKLLKDIGTAKSISTLDNQNIKFNLNNHNIKAYSKNPFITNNGTLKVTDDTETVTKTSKTFSDSFITNNNSLIIEKVKLHNNSFNTSVIVNNGTFNLTNGELSTNYSTALVNNGTSTINGNIKKIAALVNDENYEYDLIINNENSSLTITGGSFRNMHNSSLVNNYGDLTITGGNFESLGKDAAWGAGVIMGTLLTNNTGSTALITGGTYPNNSRNRMIINDGTATFKNVETNYGNFGINNGILTLENVVANNLSSGYDKNGAIKNTNILNIIDGNYSIKALAINNTGTMTIKGAIIDNPYNSYNAIEMSGDTASLNIESGTIKAKRIAINNTGAGTITLGKKGDLINNALNVSKESPKIEGGTTGINSSNTDSKINFYDGEVIGQTAISGVIGEVETGYGIVTEIDSNNLEHKYLDKVPIIRNKRTNTEYYSIKEAIEAASNNDTLVFIGSPTILETEESVVVDTNQDLILDLNGQTITSDNELLLENKGTLKIINDSDEQGRIVSNNSKLFKNTGTLTLDSGIYEKKNNEENNLILNEGSLIVNENVTIKTELNTSEILVINDGTLELNGTIETFRTIALENNSVANINGNIRKTVDIRTSSANASYSDLIRNNEDGVMTIADGNIRDASGWSYTINNKGTLNITGGNFDINGQIRRSDPESYHYTYFIKNDSDANTTITGGTYEGERARLIDNIGESSIKNITWDNYYICDNSGTLTLENVTANSLANWSPYSGDTKFSALINSGTLTLKNGSYKGTLKLVTNTGNFKVIGSTIESTTDNAIETSGTSIIESGTVKSPKVAINNTGSGTVTLGIKGDILNDSLNVSKVNPKIEGTTKGIISSGTLNFYDGEVIGGTAISGTISETETGYGIHLKTEDSLEHKYLDKLPLVKNKRTNEEYYSLGEAIEDSSNNDTLMLLESVTILSVEPKVTVSDNQSLTLDLNGKTLLSDNEVFLENKGTLKVIDDSDSQGALISNASKLFKNTGTLILEDGLFEKRITETNNLIENNGTLKIKGDAIVKTTLSDSNELIVNNGELDVEGGTITTSSTRAITNNSILNISGGTISHSELKQSSLGFIANSSNGTINIFGGTFTGTNGYSNMFRNEGSITITDGTFNIIGITLINNYGTLLVTGGNYPRNYGKLVINSGTVTIKNITYNLYELATNYSTLTLENVIIQGDINYTSNNTIILNTGTLNITGSTFNLTGTSTNLYTSIIRNKDGGTLNYENSNITSNFIGLLNENATSNIKSGSIISNNKSGIEVDSRGTLNLGVEGGIPDTNNPYIKGKNYGVYNSGTFNYYDGRVVGETGSIYGTINKTENGYKEQRESITNNETNVTTIESTLTLMGETEKVAIVNNINFTSLQSAINYAVANEVPNVILYSNVVLEENLTKPEGININLYLNGRTITQGNYIIDEGITLIDEEEPSGVLGAIYKFFANILGTEINPKNIIIYQMNDGEELESNEIYHLYKLIDGDYKLIKLDEESISEYKIGKETTDLRTNRGKLFINDIGEGSYKLISEDKELVFEINANSVSSNIRINTRSSNKRISTSEASLIIMIKTGIIRHPFIFILLVLLITIVHLILFKKYIEKRE